MSSEDHRPLVPEGMVCPPVGFPDKFDLALRFGEGPLGAYPSLTDSDRLVLDALSRHAKYGPCNVAAPYLWDTVERARWAAWRDLGNRSRMEAMFMYTQAVEELEPRWWAWPPLGLLPPSSPRTPSGEGDNETRNPAGVKGPITTYKELARKQADDDGDAEAPAAAVAAPASPPALAPGTWSDRWSSGAPARYRHACAVVGARLFVWGGRTSSGRLAGGLHVLDLLGGAWTEPDVCGAAPELRWGHSMDAYNGWIVVFGGHRRRDCLADTALLHTEKLEWRDAAVAGSLPPPRGNHASAICSGRLWVFGGDAPGGLLPHKAWWLGLHDLERGTPRRWEIAAATGAPPPPSADHTASTIGKTIVLLGGSSDSGYTPLSHAYVFHVEKLSWTTMRCGGAVPRARAGHGSSAAAAAEGGRWPILVFGGGDGAIGYDDLHALDDKFVWRRLPDEQGSSKDSRPQATEGAAMAMSGGILLVVGGYTSRGAVGVCYAHAGVDAAENDAAARPSPGDVSKGAVARGRGSGAAAPAGRPPVQLLLLACPPSVGSEAHATAARAALSHSFGGMQVVGAHVATTATDANPVDEVCRTHEEALSALQARLDDLRVQCLRTQPSAASLLSQASMVGSVQPLVFKLASGGVSRSLFAHWVGLLEVTSGRTAVACSAAREVSSGEASSLVSSASLDTESQLVVSHAWRTLVKSW